MAVNGFVIENGVLKKYTGTAREITVPSGVKRIGKWSFYKSSVVKVTLPEGVKVIEEQAFQGCAALKEVVIGEGCEEIGDYAFWCENPPDGRRITLPSTLKKIGKLAFFPKSLYLTQESDTLNLVTVPRLTLITPFNRVAIDYAVPYVNIEFVIHPTENEVKSYLNERNSETDSFLQLLYGVDVNSKAFDDARKELSYKQWHDALEILWETRERRYCDSGSQSRSDNGKPWYYVPICDDTPLTSSRSTPEGGPLATAFNCGMPYHADNGETLSSQASVEPIDISDI